MSEDNDRRAGSVRNTQVPNDILIGIYEQLGKLSAGQSENSALLTGSMNKLEALEKHIDRMYARMDELEKADVKNSMKWSIVAFFASVLTISGINYAIASEYGKERFVALPHKMKVETQDNKIRVVDE